MRSVLPRNKNSNSRLSSAQEGLEELKRSETNITLILTFTEFGYLIHVSRWRGNWNQIGWF